MDDLDDCAALALEHDRDDARVFQCDGCEERGETVTIREAA